MRSAVDFLLNFHFDLLAGGVSQLAITVDIWITAARPTLIPSGPDPPKQVVYFHVKHLLIYVSS